MNMDYICREVEKLKKKYHETDPFKLCEDMGIILLHTPMGTYPGACKGFFLTQSRKRSITINSDLPESLQRIIVTHELGHAVLHAKAVGVKAFHDFELFDSTSLMEYEANIFATQIALPDDDFLELVEHGYDVQQIADAMYSDVNLVALKADTLISQVYRLRSQKYKNDFLRYGH